MEPEYSESPGKNLFTLQPRKDGPKITIRSNFDSGNIGKVQLGLNASIVISPANDCAGTKYESHAKGWFHFAVSGHQMGSRIKFIVKRMNQLNSSGKFLDYFRPVFRYKDGPWERVEQAMVFNRQDDVELHFEMKFEKATETFFAYSYPFSFTDCEYFLAELKTQARAIKSIYYHDQILIQSVQGRPLHLLTISSPDQKLSSREAPIDDHMFTVNKCRAFKYEESKKIILISGRVHPGEAPASHTMNGILKFLVSKDARAEILRKNFVFKVIPMLNPDGVFNGHYRMDTLNQNLNRFYLNPDPFKQPSAFGLRKLGEYYKMEERLAFYIDLHSHPQRKGNFIYGNSVQNQEDQIQTQLFPKLLAMNCVEFEYENSCFSKNHMTLKDRNEDMSKEGCGRVVFHRDLSQIYSYTMECGYTCSGSLNELAPLSNPHRKFQKLGIIHDEIDNIKSNYYCSGKPLYLTIRSYENLGRCILISILDLFGKNPFSRIPNSSLKSLEGVKKLIGDQINKANKEYKVYSNKNNALNPSITSNPKTPVNFNIKRISERQKNNQTFALGRSIPRTMIGIPSLEKKVFSSKVIERQKVPTKLKENERRRTLPKMKGNK